MVAAEAAAVHKTGEEDAHRSNTPSRKAWAATALCTVSIQPARITQAPLARGNCQITTQRQHGIPEKVEVNTGHRPSASASSNRATQPMQASQHQSTDRDWGRMITSKKKPRAKQ